MTIRLPNKGARSGSSKPARGAEASALPMIERDQRQADIGDSDELFTLKVAAAFVDYAPVTLRRWIKDKVLVAYRANGNGSYRILKSDLLKVLIKSSNS